MQSTMTTSMPIQPAPIGPAQCNLQQLCIIRDSALHKLCGTPHNLWMDPNSPLQTISYRSPSSLMARPPVWCESACWSGTGRSSANTARVQAP